MHSAAQRFALQSINWVAWLQYNREKQNLWTALGRRQGRQIVPVTQLTHWKKKQERAEDWTLRAPRPGEDSFYYMFSVQTQWPTQ